MNRRHPFRCSLGAALLVFSIGAQSQFAVEDADDNGVLNPVDYSERHYMDLMQRFPERSGIICYNAYLLDKTFEDADTLEFFKTCASSGSPGAMIYLAHLYESGRGTEVDTREAARWVRKAAEMGYAVGQYHYGMALLDGRGVTRDREAAEHWLALAAAQGDSDALAVLQNLRGL